MGEQLSGGPLLRALRRVADLPSLPPAVLKTLEWTLRKDIQEIEKVCFLHSCFSNNKQVCATLYLHWFFSSVLPRTDIQTDFSKISYISTFPGNAKPVWSTLMDVEQSVVGERGGSPEHPAHQHQRLDPRAKPPAHLLTDVSAVRKEYWNLYRLSLC